MLGYNHAAAWLFEVRCLLDSCTLLPPSPFSGWQVESMGRVNFGPYLYDKKVLHHPGGLPIALVDRMNCAFSRSLI